MHDCRRILPSFLAAPGAEKGKPSNTALVMEIQSMIEVMNNKKKRGRNEMEKAMCPLGIFAKCTV